MNHCLPYFQSLAEYRCGYIQKKDLTPIAFLQVLNMEENV